MTVTSEASADLIRRHAGGGLRRIAESAALTIVDGEGSYVIDDRERSYLDFVTGYGVAALGHRHPHWVRAVTEQARHLSTSPFHTPQLATYLEALAEILPPDLDRIALFSGGAEAVEAAVRVAQLASGRPDLLSFRSAFHGKTLGVRFLGGAHEAERRRAASNWIRLADFPECTGHSAIDYDHCDESAAALCTQLSRRDDLENVGAVIVEPILGTAGNVPPKRPFLAELRKVCDARGWLLILDESITGFGRTGHFLASELFDVDPDIIVLGKAMAGGFPLSGVAASSDAWAASSLDAMSAMSTSYGGNPLACSAGLAVLDVIAQDSFLANVRRVGQLLAEGLSRISDISPHMSQPRGVGLMLGFDIVDSRTGGLASQKLCAQLFCRCRDRGLLLAADVPRVRLSPPLTLSTAEATEFLTILDWAMT